MRRRWSAEGWISSARVGDEHRVDGGIAVGVNRHLIAAAVQREHHLVELALLVHQPALLVVLAVVALALRASRSSRGQALQS
jgi:hypothetical protein